MRRGPFREGDRVQITDPRGKPSTMTLRRGGSFQTHRGYFRHEDLFGLPEGSVIWPERAEEPEPWMRYEDYWESVSIFADNAGELQCACGDGFTVLRLGGGE